MRDWNKTSVCSKRFLISSFSAYLWGIETQLQLSKDLSRKKIFSLPMRDWNFSVLIRFCLYLSIFSLPMRDWNIVKCHDFVNYNQRFSAYLWGIETFFRLQGILKYKMRFSAYLWGIETNMDDYVPKQLSRIFSLPMRDWNAKLLRIIIQMHKAIFSLPMRDWNWN